MKEMAHLKGPIEAWSQVGYLQNNVAQSSKVNYSKTV